tara:strand:+ start:5 stop:427 length:423 start_codon:yes stop_codon:yes gene_type:complete
MPYKSDAQRKAVHANKKIETKNTKIIPTPYMGNQLFESEFKSDGTKYTKQQKKIIQEFVKNHTTDPNYVPTWLHQHSGKYFAGATVRYFPKDAKNRAYTDTMKTLWVGKRGGIKRFTVRSALGNERNLKGLYDYYKTAKD